MLAGQTCFRCFWDNKPSACCEFYLSLCTCADDPIRCTDVLRSNSPQQQEPALVFSFCRRAHKQIFLMNLRLCRSQRGQGKNAGPGGTSPPQKRVNVSVVSLTPDPAKLHHALLFSPFNVIPGAPGEVGVARAKARNGQILVTKMGTDANPGAAREKNRSAGGGIRRENHTC